MLDLPDFTKSSFSNDIFIQEGFFACLWGIFPDYVVINDNIPHTFLFIKDVVKILCIFIVIFVYIMKMSKWHRFLFFKYLLWLHEPMVIDIILTSL